MREGQSRVDVCLTNWWQTLKKVHFSGVKSDLASCYAIHNWNVKRERGLRRGSRDTPSAAPVIKNELLI